MKTIKILLLLLVFSGVTFYSCSDSDAIENKTVGTAQKSIALRTAFNEIRQANEISGRESKQHARTATNPLCFDFVYPVVFSYNNGTMITVTTFQGLVDLLANESPTFYMEGVVFPFQVTYGGAVHLITNEGELNALIQYCGFSTLYIDLQNSYCFDIVFPITFVVSGDMVVEVNSIEELLQYLSPNNAGFIDLVFPFSVTYNGQIVVVHNLFELYQMINNCDSCICSQEYAPVCVQTPTGIHEFGNMCYAICAGFTQNDLVSCGPTSACDISNAAATVMPCLPDGAYGLQLNWDYGNMPASTPFTIYDSNGNVLGGTSYTFSQLPLTYPHQPNSATGQAVTVTVILANGACEFPLSWTEPICGCPCPTNIDPVCVQTPTGLMTYNNACLAECAGYTSNDFIECGVAPNNFGTQLGSCFQMVYPVTIGHQGAVVIVHNDGELLPYWFPAMGPLPNIIYPVTATFGNSVYTFQNQAAFQAQISASCP